MVRKIESTYTCHAIVNTGPYEAVHFTYSEKIEFDREEFSEGRASMIKRVNSTVEHQVQSLRSALEDKGRGARRSSER